MSEIATVEVETGPNPVGSVIWLHGLGADGHDFEPIVPELRCRNRCRSASCFHMRRNVR